ncbi:hypothetical protein [Microbispora sp. ATCC PTA-5024]|uniref:hypothetical protein n=1 Tax=Microbispora sp. ATCC PTA-5024 TaxID=316330 RepID=UPI0003DC45ED|nr:hypothetical protein [Microbispora sp. ATCC PTA-5024]ETK36148.1 hypothetical protein MPTA5024_11015 [Microbispora sp. ATCC PTA-5024]
MTDVDDNTRAALASRLAATQQVTETTARAMVDDVWERGPESPYVAVVWPVLGAILRPIIDAMATADPDTPGGVAEVVAAAEVALPEVFGREGKQHKLS